MFKKHSPKNHTLSLPQQKQIRLQNNALIRLKFIHNRILNHMKMKHFLETHEINQFLNQLNILVTNVDEIEAFRKRIKNMLLTINDSIMEFEEAVSSGEITFNCLTLNESEKMSATSSGVSTLDDTSSLSSLVLTNSNFQTISNNQLKVDSTKSKSSAKIYSTAMNNQQLSSSNTTSMELINTNVSNRTNFKAEKYENVDYFNSLKNNTLLDLCNIEHYTQETKNSLNKCSAVMNLTASKLTNDFRTSRNDKRVEKNDDIEHNLSNKPLHIIERKQTKKSHCKDLFRKPLPIIRKNTKSNSKTTCNKKNSFHSEKNKNITEQNLPAISTTNTPALKVEKYDYLHSLKTLNLEDSDKMIDRSESLKILQSAMENDLNIPDVQNYNNCETSLSNIEYDSVSDDSEKSEIFSLTDINSLHRAHSKEKNNSESENMKFIINEKNRNISQTHIDYSGRNNPTEFSYFIDSSQNSHMKQIEKSEEKCISQNQCFVPNSLGQIFPSPIYFHSDSGPSKGVKRRIINASSNLEMINGNIIAECGKNCISLENYSNDLTELNSSSASDTVIHSDEYISDLNKELKEATDECSKIWKNLNDLLDEANREEIKKNSFMKYNIGKLEFPTGYENNYKYLDDIIFEFKSIGYPNISKQVEDPNIFFEDAMDNWADIQKIVHYMKKRSEEKLNNAK